MFQEVHCLVPDGTVVLAWDDGEAKTSLSCPSCILCLKKSNKNDRENLGVMGVIIQKGS